MPTPSRRPPPVSALDVALHRVGDRWSLLLVEALLGGPRRFGELLDDLDGLAPNILSNRLKALEAEGLLAARPYSDRPRRVTYVLTASGAELAGALRLLAQWGAVRVTRVGLDATAAPPRGLRHDRRGALVVPNVRPRRRRGGGPSARLGLSRQDPDLAAALVVVQAAVGGFDELLACPAIVGRAGHAVARAHLTERRRVGLEGGRDPLEDARHVAGVGAHEDERELVAADAPHRVGGPDVPLEDPGEARAARHRRPDGRGRR